MPSCLIDPLLQNPPADIDVPTALVEDEQHDLRLTLSAVSDPRDPAGCVTA